jgi:3-isopropylmalate/(R)-2-methylmalate dehydratase small subunit
MSSIREEFEGGVLMELVIKGRVWKFGDDLQGDYHIIPYPLIREIFDAKKLAQYCMVNVDAEFPRKAKAGDVVVGGRNFGCGVFHPHALMAFKALGIDLIVADSLARQTIASHALQEGLAMMEAQGVTAIVDTGDEIEADLATGVVRNLSNGKTVRGRPLPQAFLERLEAGGLVPYLRRRLAAAQAESGRREA